MIRISLLSAIAALLVLSVSCASRADALGVHISPAPESGSAIEARATPEAPSVESVLERYIEATGGRERSEAVRSIITRGQAEISGALRNEVIKRPRTA